jgi:hypothetical protein
MPNYIVLRLTPAVPVDPGTFTNYLNGLTVKVYEISYAHPQAGMPGDPTPPLGSASYHAGTPVALPAPAGAPPYVTYPANTSVAQHYELEIALGEVVAINFQSVATAVIEYPGGGPEYVAPDLRIELDRTGAQPVFVANVYYDVPLYNAGGPPDPSTYQDIPAGSVSAYVTLQAPLDPSLAQLQLPPDGTPPNFDVLMSAVSTVLSKDPGGAPTQAQLAALTVDQCRNIAYEIVFGPQQPLAVPPEPLESMYTNPPNTGANSDSNEQSRQDFQGKLNSYYSTNNAVAQRLTGYIYSLSAAVWCELQTQNATSALVTFPVNPGVTGNLTTVPESDVIFTGALGADVPAAYFYALTAQMPVQTTPAQRYQMATMASQQQNLSRLIDAITNGILSATLPAVNPAQAARLLDALSVPAGSPAVQCPITKIQPIWSDWLAYPKTSPPPDNWKSYQPADDISDFWPAEAAAQPGHFLDLVLVVLTQGYMVTTTTSLADAIKANLTVTPVTGPPAKHITSVTDLVNALTTDWQNFFAPGGVVDLSLLPPFTQPGTADDRVKAFIRYVQKFFDLRAPQFTPGAPTAGTPASLHLPTFDLIETCITNFGGLTFGNPLSAADLQNLAVAAGNTVAGDKVAQDWLVQTIVTINDLAILAKLPGKPASFCFSVMEALYARGFTSLDSVLEIPQESFEQALAGTQAYDFAATIYSNAGTASGFSPPGTGAFGPINPGSLKNCIPPLYVSPLGPIAYLHEMLQVSEASTCETPFAPPASGHTNLEGALDGRRGILGSLAVSKANLETPLPRIDLVNECLEYMAATTPPTPHGVVYDTSQEELAGHKLCAGECCCDCGCADERAKQERPHEEGEHPEAGPACHKPAALFAALPEYSSPATPFSATANVEPAVYNKLKLDFLSSCCQPYSQALDVSRTYLRHFKTCRFEAMRTFRRCITEFVLDPVHEPAGFQSHLWRYPVRIDTAIEYLGISPETYTLLFEGPQPKACAASESDHPNDQRAQLPPWILYGFVSENLQDQQWTSIAVRLPEFLRRTCLSYCEFLQLWKTGIVPFRNGADREKGQFPECEPCCLDQYWLQFPEEGDDTATALYKLGIFIRLWCILKEQCGAQYSFEQLQDICQVLQLYSGNTINPDFIRQLAAFQMLRDHFQLPLMDRAASVPPNSTGAARTHLLALWEPGAAKWHWAVHQLIRRIAFYAMCHHKCERRSPEFEKLLAANLDPLSRLAGFDPAAAQNTWHAQPTHTLRFAEVLAKIYASPFSIGEILYLFTAGEHLDGDDPFPLQEQNEALDLPLGLPEDDPHHSLWRLRCKLLEMHVPEGEARNWSWNRIASTLQHEFGYDPLEIKAFGEHFFPTILEESGQTVDTAKRRYFSPLNPADTAPLMWNVQPYGPFHYDAIAQQLWTELPLSDKAVIEQLTRIRPLKDKEQQAVQDLYFQPRAMLARFAFIFSDYIEAEAQLVQQRDEFLRWESFREQFALCHLRCHAIAQHLAEHVAAASGQQHPEGAEAARLILRFLYADENEPAGGASWEDDSGHAPALTWVPAPNGSAFAALLGIVGTGMLAQFRSETGTLTWQAPSGAVASFGRVADYENVPVPTVLPSLGFKLKPEQMRFVSVLNGLAMRDATGAWLGGAEGFSVQWTGALLIEREGVYEFTARSFREEECREREEEDEVRQQWRIILKRGQKTWIVVSHNWPGEHNLRHSSLPLRRGAYELTIEFVQPSPTFFDEDDLFPLHSGLAVEYAGPDTDGHRTSIPHNRLLLISKDGPLGTGITGLSSGASSYLSQLYVSSLRDIRRTYQRAFKALLFVHRAELSAHRSSTGQSELGYLLDQKDRFAGASYYFSGGSYHKHNADFDFNLLPLLDDYSPPATDARINPSPQRMQALFDCWERIFDYCRARHEVRERADRRLWLLFDEASDKKPAHPAYLLRHMGADARHWYIDLAYFQGQSSPVYQVTSDDLTDDRWVLRAWHADRWIRHLERSFTAKDITKARPDLWASDDPSAIIPGETATGNANLSQFICDGCLENGDPVRYEDLKRLNDGLRERARRALLRYLCGPAGIAKQPKELSELLLLDVEAGLSECASRIDEAISAVQTFIQRSRLNLEPGWKVSSEFALLWDRRFASYQIWEACKRRELYKENWIEWCEIEKTKKVEAFRFLDEELRRATLTIARPGGVDFWPDERAPWHPSLLFLQERQVSEMQLLEQPREGLGLLASEERAGRPSWLAMVPQQFAQQPPPSETGAPRPADGVVSRSTPAAAASGGSGSANVTKLPFWMESAIALGTQFIRVAASGYPPALNALRPHPAHQEGNGACCVDCCTECGRVHPCCVDEYYFWLVDGERYEATTQDSYYDHVQQTATPWHDQTQLKTLLDWSPDPVVRLAWCRVHNGEFGQPRRSEFGIPVPASGTRPDLTLQGRVGDSLYFGVTNAASPTAGFRYDLATDSAEASTNLTVPSAPPATYPGGLIAYPYFGYFAPGARLFPWSLYTPAVSVAHSLRAHCRFEAALKWYGLVYDPLQSDNTWMHCEKDTPPPTPSSPSGNNPPGIAVPRAAGTPGPADPAMTNTSLPAALNPPASAATAAEGGNRTPGTMCCDSTDVSCAVARNRSVVLHYLDTLLEWGDAALRRNDPEAFQKARLIFDTAAKIMGPVPVSVVNTPAAGSQTVATFTPLFPPLNPRLMMLYDRLNDRLALIHAWMNARRRRNGTLELDVPYFGDDPFREGWRSNCQVCPEEAGWCLPHSPYRFQFLIGRAQELAARVRELGAALLANFEKGDVEFVAAMRARHERELATLGLKAREDQWRDADWQVQALYKTKENRQNDRRYYAQLIQAGKINNEQQYESQVGISQGERTAGIISEGIAEAMSIIPDLFVGFPCEETWLPVGTKLSGLFQALARISYTLAEMASVEGSLDLTEAGWDRRLQDWVHRVELLDIEIEQIELQILAAERRRAQALRELNIQQRQIEQARELQDFLRDKLSSHAVYLCLQKETAELYRKMYELALHAARQTERAFNFERGHTTRRFLPEESWDNLHEGLLAGERLELALQFMEKEYEDRNIREEELTKHISLRLHFPIEFLRLKVTGRCEIEIPEWMFDLDYPGHYMRRIKNVALTIPCVSGPYTGVHCRLTLLSSATRIDPLLRKPAHRCCNECEMNSPYQACLHDPRVVRQYAAREAIATSSGRNDTGMFELNFRDDRYLPFEYHGAISRWRIELPAENNFFDMDSLTDVVMHLNYTAREGGDLLRYAANEVAQKFLPGNCWTFFDIRHDFPDAWELFRTQSNGKAKHRELVLRLSRKMFPFLPGRPDIFINRMALLFETPCRRPDPCDADRECPCPVDEKQDAHSLDVITCGGERQGHREEEETDMLCVASREWPELYHGIVETQLGPLSPQEGHREVRFRFRKDVEHVSRAYLFCRYRGGRYGCR